MKHWIMPFLILLLYSCRSSVNPDAATSLQNNTIEPLQETDSSYHNLYAAQLSGDTVINIPKIATDTVTFVELNDNGDYPFCLVRKNSKLVSLVYNDQLGEQLNFLRGDTLEIQWEMDSIWIAGEGEKLEFTEWLIQARKIKDGKVHAFRKLYKKPIKYWYAQSTHYSDSFKNYIYGLVEYYIAYSQKKLLQLHLQKPEDTDFIYSIESREVNGRNYTAIGLANDMGTHSSIIQWLYLDSETNLLYEYDLANELLIPFP